MEFQTLKTGDASTQATEQFVRFMDCFFDCFNVRSIVEGKKTRKATRDPYWTKNDWRFTVRFDRCHHFVGGGVGV
jgi:hypothetical protein